MRAYCLHNILLSSFAVADLRTGHSGHALPLWIWVAHAGYVKERYKRVGVYVFIAPPSIRMRPSA